MVDRLMRWRDCGMLLVFGLCALPFAAHAQALMADPTRPPAGIENAAQALESSGPVLQSVMIPKKGTPVAVIGGQTVALGAMYGENRLIRLSEREAVLEGPGGIERLQLTPGVEKTNIVTKKSAARDAQNRGKP